MMLIFPLEVEEAINNPVEFGLDFYSREGLDACRDNGYFNTPSLQLLNLFQVTSTPLVFLFLIFKLKRSCSAMLLM
jgi:hypothetical protein